jgi:hypothetical protein
MIANHKIIEADVMYGPRLDFDPYQAKITDHQEFIKLWLEFEKNASKIKNHYGLSIQELGTYFQKSDFRNVLWIYLDINPDEFARFWFMECLHLSNGRSSDVLGTRLQLKTAAERFGISRDEAYYLKNSRTFFEAKERFEKNLHTLPRDEKKQLTLNSLMREANNYTDGTPASRLRAANALMKLI